MSHFSAAFRNKETRNVLSACDEMKGPKDLGNGVGAVRRSNYRDAFYAPTYWNMRFSVAGAAMGAHVQNGIMLRDRTRNLVVVGRQPHPNPNYAPCSPGGRPHRAAAVDPPGEV